MYRIGTWIRRNSARTSQARMARRRIANTFGCTEEIATRTAANNGDGESGPTSQNLVAKFGSGKRNKSGASNEQRKRCQPRTGLVANPAQRTTASRFAGFVAAYLIA